VLGLERDALDCCRAITGGLAELFEPQLQLTPRFETPLRIRVGPEMRGMKVTIRYLPTARGLVDPVRGRLKLVFRRQRHAWK
jgi:hypothetical protein